ncbi:hypothetical protein GA0070624_1808 [Micromonospora rhizosphaerae]|uniref:SalK n=2 Tax=Micromonospora rhizosphaerae TaxID=568872 RepID=A0A1C6RR69_9ACTN|nr:hypothetical protein GA0070624_1808 [Micromonospora rhizosphaerae]
MEPKMVRQMWQLIEPVHALLYYAPELTEEAAALGLPTDERWPSYFAWRSAPLGPAGPQLVTATYYSFSPRMVAEYVPAIWSTADPAKVLDARLSGVDRALRALLGDRVHSPELAEAAALARRAAEAADVAGRPLAAANADLPWPDAPHLVLWQAATVLREHRGDGHVAALLTAGLDPTEALVSFAAVGAAPVEVFASRRWTEEEWAAARDRLATRGLVDAAGVATPEGHRLRDEVERRTDELAAAPWRALGPAAGRLAQLVAPVTRAVVASGMLPTQSTLGIRR